VILISIPIFAPVVRIYGIDPVWFGVLVCIMLQTSYLTPPMAPSIFYLRSIAPSDMSYRSMYLGVLPFIAIQLIVLAIVLFYPLTATYLPTVLFRL
jgi:TRAP-type mannitol/chloroaromatic compound transport system permease large subunit